MHFKNEMFQFKSWIIIIIFFFLCSKQNVVRDSQILTKNQ